MKRIFDRIVQPHAHTSTLIVGYDRDEVKLGIDPKTTYLTVGTTEDAKRLYPDYDNIVVDPTPDERSGISEGVFGLVVMPSPRSIAEIQWGILRLATKFKGATLVFRYDHFKVNPYRLTEYLLEAGVAPMMNVSIDDKRYVVAQTVLPTTTKEARIPSRWAHSLYGPAVDPRLYKPTRRQAFIPFNGFHPAQFYDKVEGNWVMEFHKDEMSLHGAFFEEVCREKMLGGSVLPLNQEQMAIAIASGRAKDEVRLKNGQVYIFKGTEKIDVEQKPKLGLDGVQTGIRHVEKKRTVIIGLEMNRGDFVRFE